MSDSRNAGLKLKPLKCEFFKQELMYLGRVVSEEGIQTDSKKVEVIQKWPTQTNFSFNVFFYFYFGLIKLLEFSFIYDFFFDLFEMICTEETLNIKNYQNIE